MDNKELIIALQKTPTISKGKDHKNVYSNVCRAGIGPWDIRLIFGNMVENEQLAQVCEDQVTVIMSPGEAKAIYKVLGQAIAGYESNFGEIKDLVPLLEKLKAQGKAAPPKKADSSKKPN